MFRIQMHTRGSEVLQSPASQEWEILEVGLIIVRRMIADPPLCVVRPRAGPLECMCYR